MKKLFYFLFSFALLGCSENEPVGITSDYEGDLSTLTIELPEGINNFGKAVATEIKKTVSIMVERGADYSKLPDSVEIGKCFYKDWLAVHPQLARTRSVEEENLLQMNTAEFMARYHMLTSTQIDYVNKIIRECELSTSNKNLMERLIVLKNSICIHVPEIERDRLLYVISALFYAVQTISEMESEGLMLKTPYNYHELQFAKIKTRSENAPSATSTGCHSFLATVWCIAVGEPTPAGEIVASVVTIVYAGMFLYEVVTCISESLSVDDCISKYDDCMKNNLDWAKSNSGGYGYTMCAKCLEYCRAQKKWDCPRPI